MFYENRILKSAIKFCPEICFSDYFYSAKQAQTTKSLAYSVIQGMKWVRFLKSNTINFVSIDTLFLLSFQNIIPSKSHIKSETPLRAWNFLLGVEALSDDQGWVGPRIRVWSSTAWVCPWGFWAASLRARRRKTRSAPGSKPERTDSECLSQTFSAGWVQAQKSEINFKISFFYLLNVEWNDDKLVWLDIFGSTF